MHNPRGATALVANVEFVKIEEFATQAFASCTRQAGAGKTSRAKDARTPGCDFLNSGRAWGEPYGLTFCALLDDGSGGVDIQSGPARIL